MIRSHITSLSDQSVSIADMKEYFYYIVLLFMSVCLVKSNNKTFTRCELASELIKQGFPDHQIRDWVCLVEAESSRQTDAVGGPDDDGSFDYGLFQINDRYWCNSGDQPGKECHIRCQDLLTDDITLASNCTKKIYDIQGFDAWVGWVNKCHKKKLADLNECHLIN